MLDIGIDNQLASDYGICMVERPVIPTAEQEVEHIEVSGRHGSLTKRAFKDVPLKIKFNMLEEENIAVSATYEVVVDEWKTLYFTDDDVSKIKHVVVGDIVNEIEEHGEFEVDFKLIPLNIQRM